VGFDGVDAMAWMRDAAPGRVVAIGLGASPKTWCDALARITRDGTVPLRALFVSREQAKRLGADGPLLPPLSGIPLETTPSHPARRWTIGIVAGRGDVLDDVSEGPLVRRIVAEGVAVAIREPGPLRFELGALPGVRFEAREERPLEAFVAAVDALLIPARRRHGEGLDREVQLALASQRGVVVRRTSIHAGAVRDAACGRVVADDGEALAAILDLARAERRSVVPASPPRDATAIREAVATALGLDAPPGPPRAARIDLPQS
jgi:hypothetical protein